MLDIFRINFAKISDDDKEIINRFKISTEVASRFLTVNTKPSRELSLAMTKFEEAVMWGVKAITAKYYEDEKDVKADND